ncbi:ethylbenzene dehydrogenase-related protein [Sulfurospirillum halorespirans]|uniref:Molybdopterin oxidoreductase, membrane-integral gamma subunit n=1 Tax=Sulfurospirillum halorespirans DSM 13726 TaxID=1193502 RepID=A0A1D7TNZ3_9BACT|nr:ethylbenzene dehydrogenase-related protein [Sulfurospirillum halorespirans]AOO66728.1 molybdopterin oxidoreductase, membrane-integral gamma subunit [Sulfurospirillum halorespirans DSM 13726]
MKTVKTLILCMSLLGLNSLMAQSLNALHVKEDLSKVSLTSPLWQKAKGQSVEVYPQTTIEMNDAELMKANEANLAKILHVKTLSDGKSVAFLLQWKDKTKSLQTVQSTTDYSDGFAVQFSTANDKLPYIGMGSENRAVIVHLQKATGTIFEPNNSGDVYHQVNTSNQNTFAKELTSYKNEVAKQGSGDYQRAFIAEGFRSMTQIRDNAEPSLMEMKYDKGMWSALLVRPLKSEHLSLQDSFPVAFAIWDGEKKNRDGSKLLSAWVGVSLDAKAKALALLDEVKGDASNGETLMMENCSACHQYKTVKNAPNYMAPNLSNIGGYANASYLKESIMEPSAVVVPGYNLNAHKNFLWYTSDEKGVRTSTMPPFAHLDEKSVNDLVAFMKTLKVEVEK